MTGRQMDMRLSEQEAQVRKQGEAIRATVREIEEWVTAIRRLLEEEQRATD